MTEINKKSEENNLFNILGGLPFTRRGAWFGIFADMFMRPIYGTRLFIGSRRGSVIERGSNEFMKFFPGNDFSTDCGLNGDIKLLTRQQFFQALTHPSSQIHTIIDMG